MACSMQSMVRAIVTLIVLVTLGSYTTIKASDQPAKSWRQYVQECADILIRHGTDRYGPVKSAMFMTILDPKDYNSPEKPEFLDSNVYYEGRPHRRAMAGTNSWYDQAFYRTLYRLTELTGQAKYARAADAAIDATFEHTVNPDTGLPCWGSHLYYNAYKDKAIGFVPHETLVYLAEWDRMFDRKPAAVRRLADAVWDRHVCDNETGQFNRHDDGRPGCDFAFCSGPFAVLFASVYAKTNEKVYLDRAKKIADWHWRHRNRKTNLVPDAPSTGARYDAHHCFTTVTGPHVSHLLRCYELSGDDWFKDVAVAYLKAYDKYGYDPKAQTYWAMLKLDGTPVPDKSKGSGYDAWAPYGHVDMWKNTMFSYEFPPAAAQSYIYAYEITAKENAGRGDPELLRGAKRWATAIRKQLPVKTPRRWGADLKKVLPELERIDGSYAEDYARVISFFVHLYRATGDKQDLETAQAVARDALDKLYAKGLFKGHVAKPYYESTNGVGLLLNALLELDSPDKPWRPAL